MEAFTQYYQIRSLISLCLLCLVAITFTFFVTSFTSPDPVDMVVRIVTLLMVVFSVRFRLVNISHLLTFLFLIGAVVMFYLSYEKKGSTIPPVVVHLAQYSVAPLLACFLIRGKWGYLISFLTIVLYAFNLHNSADMDFIATRDEKVAMFVYGTLMQIFPLWILLSFEEEMKTYYKLLEKFLDLTEERSKEKTNFISRMSHELRTPLHGLLSSANLIRQTPLTQEQNAFLSAFDSCGQVILDVITKILDITKIESGDLELTLTQFSLFEMVKSASESLTNQAEQKGINLSIDFKLHPAGFDVCSDKNHLREILLNVSIIFLFFFFLFLILMNNHAKPATRFWTTPSNTLRKDL